MTIEKEKAIISFDYDSGGFKKTGKKITELYIAGEDKLFYPANAKLMVFILLFGIRM